MPYGHVGNRAVCRTVVIPLKATTVNPCCQAVAVAFYALARFSGDFKTEYVVAVFTVGFRIGHIIINHAIVSACVFVDSATDTYISYKSLLKCSVTDHIARILLPGGIAAIIRTDIITDLRQTFCHTSTRFAIDYSLHLKRGRII